MFQLFKKYFVLCFALVLTLSFSFSTINADISNSSTSNLSTSGYEMGGYATGGIPAWNSWSKQSDYKGPLIKPTKQWEVSLIGIEDDKVTVAPDGTSYITTWDSNKEIGYLYSISPDGKINWRNDYTDGWFPFVPAIANDGMLYVGSYWRYGETYPGYDNKAFDGKIEKLNPANHTVIWSYTDVPGKIMSQPVLDKDGSVFFITHNSSTASWDANDIFALNQNGSLKWSKRLSGGNFGYLVNAKGNYLYVVTGSNGQTSPYKLCAVRKDNGAVDKQFVTTDMSTLQREIAIGNDGTIYVAGYSPSNIYALDPITLSVKKSADSYNFGTPIMIDGSGNIWSNAGISKSKDTLFDTNALAFNINMLATNGYFGYMNSWGYRYMIAKFPDNTEAWKLTAEETGNAYPSLMVVPRDGWLYTIQSDATGNKVVAYMGSTSAGSAVSSVGLNMLPFDNTTAGKNVTLSAKANGGTNVEYKFTISKMDNQGKFGAETIIRNYGAANVFEWKSVEGLYKIFVYARSIGGSDEKKSAEQYYNVMPGVKTAVVTLTASPDKQSKVGKSVTLKAKEVGFAKAEYKYYIMNKKDIEYRVMNDWTTKTTYSWKFRAVGEYYFKIEARDAVTHTGESTSNIILIKVLP